MNGATGASEPRPEGSGQLQPRVPMRRERVALWRRSSSASGRQKNRCPTRATPASEVSAFTSNAEGVTPSSPGLPRSGYPGGVCERMTPTPTGL